MHVAPVAPYTLLFGAWSVYDDPLRSVASFQTQSGLYAFFVVSGNSGLGILTLKCLPTGSGLRSLIKGCSAKISGQNSQISVVFGFGFLRQCFSV